MRSCGEPQGGDRGGNLVALKEDNRRIKKQLFSRALIVQQRFQWNEKIAGFSLTDFNLALMVAFSAG
jgi:hypothetical protein